MSEQKTLFDLVISFLKKNPNERFIARDIANYIVANEKEWVERKIKNSKQDNLDVIQQLVAEISGIKNKDKNIETTEERPRKFYYFTLDEDKEKEDSFYKLKNNLNLTKKDSPEITEQSLYKVVCNYLKSEHNVYSKRIDEKTSTNTEKGANQWLHPDIVGVQPLNIDLVNEVKELSNSFYSQGFKLWSLEVKLDLTLPKLREYFFQAVANSSWANISYFVAINIKTNSKAKEIIDELKILSNLYGIGVISLDSENLYDYSSHEILFPAKEKIEIDFAMINRLHKANKDFKAYVEAINHAYSIRKLDYRDFDFDKDLK